MVNIIVITDFFDLKSLLSLPSLFDKPCSCPLFHVWYIRVYMDLELSVKTVILMAIWRSLKWT